MGYVGYIRDFLLRMTILLVLGGLQVWDSLFTRSHWYWPIPNKPGDRLPLQCSVAQVLQLNLNLRPRPYNDGPQFYLFVLDIPRSSMVQYGAYIWHQQQPRYGSPLVAYLHRAPPMPRCSPHHLLGTGDHRWAAPWESWHTSRIWQIA